MVAMSLDVVNVFLEYRFSWYSLPKGFSLQFSRMTYPTMRMLLHSPLKGLLGVQVCRRWSFWLTDCKSTVLRLSVDLLMVSRLVPDGHCEVVVGPSGLRALSRN